MQVQKSSSFSVFWSESEDKVLKETAARARKEKRLEVKLAAKSARNKELVLIFVQKPVHIDFGTHAIGAAQQSIAGSLNLVNPNEDTIEVKADRIPKASSGFSLAGSAWTVPGKASIAIPVEWIPIEANAFREKILLSFSVGKKRCSAQVYLLGKATDARPSDTRGRSVRRKTQGRSRSLSVKGRNTERSVLGEISNTPAKKRPPARKRSPSASRQRSRSVGLKAKSKGGFRARSDIIFDSNGLDKQEYGFTGWLNFMLNPPRAESEESHAHAVLAEKQRQASVRRLAFGVYHSQELEEIQFLVDKEIVSGHLAIRKDKQLFRDLGLRNTFLQIVGAYHPIWLRLGLETVYGESIPLTVSQIKYDEGRSALSRYVAQRMLLDPEVTAAYQDSKLGPFPTNEDYRRDLQRCTIRRFLMLVIFFGSSKAARNPISPQLFVRSQLR